MEVANSVPDLETRVMIWQDFPPSTRYTHVLLNALTYKCGHIRTPIHANTVRGPVVDCWPREFVLLWISAIFNVRNNDVRFLRQSGIVIRLNESARNTGRPVPDLVCARTLSKTLLIYGFESTIESGRLRRLGHWNTFCQRKSTPSHRPQLIYFVG